jgi:hypothetical protein
MNRSWRPAVGPASGKNYFHDRHLQQIGSTGLAAVAFCAKLAPALFSAKTAARAYLAAARSHRKESPCN